MQQLSVPACYFPSTVVFVDDSRDFLLNLVLYLDEALAYKVFDSPSQALNCIHSKRCELEWLSQRCHVEYTQAQNSLLTSHLIDPHCAAIHAELYNSKRFSDISVLVADYAMPGMDGIDFCSRVDDAHIKKILLVSPADEHRAIDAVRQGLIDCYIKKNDPDIARQILNKIHELQTTYFQQMSDIILRMLDVGAPECLYDKPFARFFEDLRHQHGIVEYYLADPSGSFLLLDEDANISMLIVKTAWDDERIPAQQFVSNHIYYYAYREKADLTELPLNKVLSFHQYLETLDAEEILF